MGRSEIEIGELQVRAAEAAALLKAMSNEHRLLILCHLVSEGELAVGGLASKAFEGLSKMEAAAKGIEGEAASKHSTGAFDLDGLVK